MGNPRVRAAILCVLVALAGALLPTCAAKPGEERLQIVKHQSALLGKEMIYRVYLPHGYTPRAEYQVLYYLPSGRGSSYTVMNQLGLREAYDRLADAGEIAPMLLVAPGIDLSFGMNTAESYRQVEGGNDLVFDAGPYEDYIVGELIPMVEDAFAAMGTREGRLIGGYSMGGLAALHVALRNPQLFARAGGHSPTLFLADEVDLRQPISAAVHSFLYPTDPLDAQRNPLRLAQTADLDGLSLYLDTGPGEINARALQALYDMLAARGADAQLHLLPGTHGHAYCYAHMEAYLRFYATGSAP